MPVKSVITVDVDDAAFKRFAELYSKYDAAVKKLPAAWQQQGKATAAMSADAQAISAALLAQAEIFQRMLGTQKKGRQEVEATGRVWNAMARSTKEVAGNITRATSQLLRWTALTSVFSGLLGAGGLFGIDRLAGSVSAGRRGASGLGVSYGEHNAFGVNFGRLVDSGSFISSVNEALHDVTKRSGLYGAGLTEGDLQGKNSAQVGSQLLSALKTLAGQTPDNQLGNVLQARGLNQFVTLQDFQRLKGTSREELNSIRGSFGKDSTSLGLDPEAQKAWQDFSVQMNRAGSLIENVFVKGLTPLVPALNQLSDSAAKAIETFLAAPKLKQWITDLGTGLEKAAVYLGSEDFQNKVKSFVTAFGEVVDATIAAAGWVAKVRGVVPSAGDFNRSLGSPHSSSAWSFMEGPVSGRNNPGNLRKPGGWGFQSFGSEADGVKAIARQLSLYQNRDHLDTVRGIISKYAPPSENDTEGYIASVSKRTGFDPNQKLDLNNKDQMSALISAITKQENSKSNYTPKAVVEILDSTGGSVNVNASQLVAQ